MSNKKTEELSSVFPGDKNKKNIGEPLLRDIINGSTKSNTCQQKNREILDQFCVLLLLFSSDFSLDFQFNIFREFCQIKNRRAMSSVPPKYATLNLKKPYLNQIRNRIRFSSAQ